MSATQTRAAAAAPLILVTPDRLASLDAPTETAYMVRANYAAALVAAGGLPLILPCEPPTLRAALALADGVLITGTAPGVDADPKRRAYETQLVEHALRMQMPLLGICYGMQLIGECLGARCLKSLPSKAGVAIDHLPSAVPNVYAHTLQIEPNSLLAALAYGDGDDDGVTRSAPVVNSLHRHSLTENGRFRVTARAQDGVVEAFEADTSGFCLGVQWHPEYALSDFDRAIFRRFVCASNNYAKQKRETCYA